MNADYYGMYDWGTFESNREKVYHLVQKKFKYCFAGHSHRAGLYRIEKETKKENISTWGIIPESLKTGFPEDGVNTRYFNPENISVEKWEIENEKKGINYKELDDYFENAKFSENEVRVLVTTSTRGRS